MDGDTDAIEVEAVVATTGAAASVEAGDGHCLLCGEAAGERDERCTHVAAARLGPRFEDALAYAAALHAGQLRKGTDIPYVAHLLSVTALVLEDGGDEEETIAALLHDAAEDQGGVERLRAIARRYGEGVARIVLGCSDWVGAPGEAKPPWAERKRRYLAVLPHHLRAELRVSLADKLHNARSILADQQRLGPAAYARFQGGLRGTLWYYRELVTIHRAASADSRHIDEFDRVVTAMEALAQSP